MINSRSKGRDFEYEVIHWIRDAFGSEVKRNLDQYQTKDEGDILFPPFLIECKRYASGSWHKPEWWDQVLRSSVRLDLTPLLIYRFDRQPMRFVFRLADIGDYPLHNHETITVSQREAEMLVREKMNSSGFVLSVNDSLNIAESFGN